MGRYRPIITSLSFSDERVQTVLRATWLTAAAAVLILLIPEVQATVESARETCTASNCQGFQLPAQARRAFAQAGLSLNAYTAIRLIPIVVDIVSGFAVASLLILRSSVDRMALMTAFACILICAPGAVSLEAPHGIWSTPSQIEVLLQGLVWAFWFFIFPSGSFAPRWTILLALILLALPFIPENPASPILFGGTLISIIAVQIYRFRRISTPTQRQQTKLVLFGLGLFVATYVVALVASLGGTVNTMRLFPGIFIQSAGDIAAFPLVLSIGLAVVRYRLWDVDVLINRTLVYVALTASLVLIYLGCVVSLQALLGRIAGHQSDLAVALSTLVIAVIFNPLRRGVQNAITRTFYRGRYDAGQVLTVFGETMRDQTDIRVLQSSLMGVVDETFQPAHVSLWVRGKS